MTTDTTAPTVEYPESFLDRLELLWGRGFLSPGGAAEVEKIVHGLDLAGKAILDIGCGTGGPTLALAAGGGRVVGLDVERGVIARARANAHAAGLADRIDFRLVAPGPLPLPDQSFDLVFSKDAMIHVPDKPALFNEVLRVLRPGGVFAASDWLGDAETATSPEWARFQGLAHLSFTMATAAEVEGHMRAAGFVAVSTEDRNAWYAPLCAEEVARIEGPLRRSVLDVVDDAVYRQWLAVRRALADVVAAGTLRPTHLRGTRPLSARQ